MPGFRASSEKKRKEKTTPFGVNLMRRQVLYRAAQLASSAEKAITSTATAMLQASRGSGFHFSHVSNHCGQHYSSCNPCFFSKTRLLADPEFKTDTTAGLVMTSFATMFRFLSHAELGTCRASLVLPKQPVLSIHARSNDTTVLTVT